MKSKILKEFNQLESQREILFSHLNKINNDKINYKPASNKWSIIHHLYKSEQLSVIHIKRSVSKGGKLKKSDILSKIRGFALTASLKTNLKFKAPQNVPDFAELELYEKME